jgi:hypothetical protein
VGCGQPYGKLFPHFDTFTGGLAEYTLRIYAFISISTRMLGAKGRSFAGGAANPQASLDEFMGKAVATRPERTLRARLTKRVIDAFFVRATDDAVNCNHRADRMPAEKCLDLQANHCVAANVLSLGKPPFQRIRILSLVLDDGDDHLGRQLCGGTVERHGGYGVPVQSSIGFLLHPGGRSLPSFHLSMKMPPVRLRQEGKQSTARPTRISE